MLGTSAFAFARCGQGMLRPTEKQYELAPPHAAPEAQPGMVSRHINRLEGLYMSALGQ